MSGLQYFVRLTGGTCLLLLAVWFGSMGGGVLVASLMGFGPAIPGVSWPVALVALVTGFFAYRQAKHLMSRRLVAATSEVVT